MSYELKKITDRQQFFAYFGICPKCYTELFSCDDFDIMGVQFELAVCDECNTCYSIKEDV